MSVQSQSSCLLAETAITKYGGFNDSTHNNQHHYHKKLCVYVDHRKNIFVAWYWNLGNPSPLQYLQVHTTAYHSCMYVRTAFPPYKAMYQVFQRKTSSESSCKRNFQGQPFGQKLVNITMCTYARTYFSLNKNPKTDTEVYLPIPTFT